MTFLFEKRKLLQKQKTIQNLEYSSESFDKWNQRSLRTTKKKGKLIEQSIILLEFVLDSVPFK